MPTYEYRCAKCDQHVEVYQSFSEAPLTKHEGCGGKLTKVLSPAGIVLKGSGFYKTDNPRSASSSRSDSSSGTSDSKSDSSNGKSEPMGKADSSNGKPDSKRDSSSSTSEPKGTSDSSASKAAASV